MGTTFSIAVASAILAVAAPATVYYEEFRPSDPLADKLRAYGFFPINPPSTLVEVGSLYYVNSDASDIRAICPAEQADVNDVVNKSGSWQIQEDFSQNGSFSTNISVDFRSVIKGSADNSYVQKVHFSLTDILLEEIPLGSNLLIYTKLMKRPECSTAALEQLKSGGYVCQGQKILRATAEFKLDRDSQSKLASRAEATPGKVSEVVKAAVETQSGQSVVEREGRLLAGSALNYGVEMTPICLAPNDARFPRVLPRTMWERVVNFFLFRVVEPLLPASHDEVHVAQKSAI